MQNPFDEQNTADAAGQPIKSEKQRSGKITYGPYNPSKRTRFKGITYSDGSYADID